MTSLQQEPYCHEEILNHCRLTRLSAKASTVLRKIFEHRWSYCSELRKGNNAIAKQWVLNSAECGKQLLHMCDPSTATKIREKFQLANHNEWDITSLAHAINAVSKKIYASYGLDDRSKVDNLKSEDQFINAIRQVRNDLAHSPTGQLSNEQFNELWEKMSKALVELGEDHAELEKLEKMSILDETKDGDSKIDVKVAKMKKDGNKAFKEQRYQEANAIYLKALKLPSISSEDQGIIYSNLSASYFLLGTEEYLKKASKYADLAITVRPTWWRGYHRLGRAYLKRGKLDKAEKFLNIAIGLDPSSEDVKHELNALKVALGEKTYSSSTQKPIMEEEKFAQFSEELGCSVEAIKNMLKEAEKVPVYGDVLRGDSYRDGHGVPQDFAEAAKFYNKAAEAGSAEGMYNLALLYRDGKGVDQNFETFFTWLLKAAETTPVNGNKEEGVMQAQHALGLIYQEGIRVTRNYKEAAKWYEKAVSNGCGTSANNLGMLFKNGLGVERSAEKAFQYFQMGAQLRNIPAMQNLADSYLLGRGSDSVGPSREGVQKGMKWLQQAADLGSEEASKKLELLKTSRKFQQQVIAEAIMPDIPPEADPLNSKEHREAVEKAAKRGSVTAERVLTIWNCMQEAMLAFKNEDNQTVLSKLCIAIRLDQQNVKIPELFYEMIEQKERNSSR